MRYRLTALTPVLVGDGQKLSPIDYMVWKDQINVLDQRRIFRLLSKGPRLDGYLTQIRKAEKLDFASWGGFAQNFAGRRIPFEHPSITQHWERAYTDCLHIPTFSSGPSGPYLPAAALKGALRTAMMYTSVREGTLTEIALKFQGERPPRRPAEGPEEQVLGAAGRSRMRAVSAGDSLPIPVSALKIYLLRLSTLERKGPQGPLAPGWKPNPAFAEMAAPGVTFEGSWQEKSPGSRSRVFDAAHQWAARILALQKQYATSTGLALVVEKIVELESRLAALQRDSACLLTIGWGGGFLSKSAWLGKDSEEQRQILRALPYYQRAIQSGLPFPKTRRIVFEHDKPASLPGWVLLEVG